MATRTIRFLGRATAMAALLLALGGTVSRVYGFHDGDRWDVLEASQWQVDAAMVDEVRARLPAAFEPRARRARERPETHAMPPLSDYDVTLHGVTRTGRRRFVVLHGECTAGRPTAPPPRWTAPVDVPAPAGSGEACWFDAAFDPQAHRFTWLALGRYKPSSPADPLDCARAPFQAVDHLAGLPGDIADALRGRSDLADHGAAFQQGDIGLLAPEPLFSRRFALAAIAGDRALVAVEHGGELPEIKVWSFERRNGHWDGEERWMTTETPTSTQALLHVACRDVPVPPMRLAGAADRTAGWMLKDGTVDLDLYDEPMGLYHLRRSSTAARSEISEGFRDERLLSVEERRALRDRLLARRAELLPDHPAYEALSRFLVALVADGEPILNRPAPQGEAQ